MKKVKQTRCVRGGSNGQGSEQSPAAAEGILPRPDQGSQLGPSGVQTKNNSPGPSGVQIEDSSPSHIEAHREQILEHISAHRVTFIQGETGSGKSTFVPQFILDDATARGKGDSVRVLVAQPRRVAAVSLAKYVAQLRGERVGLDVGFAVSRERASEPGKTRLTFVTTGYLLQVLARSTRLEKISHIILDEVHVRSVEQDLLLLLLKLLPAGIGKNRRWSSLRDTKFIIMSATMDVRSLQEYLSCLLKNEGGEIVEPSFIKGRKFPVEIIHIDEIRSYLKVLPKNVGDLATRLVEISGKGVRALDGNYLPHFAVDLVTGLVLQVGKAGDCILVFVATYSDIFDINQGFEKVAKSRDSSRLRLDVMYLHSMMSREDQDAALEPPRTDTLKVIIATNVAESSLTIPNVRVVFDLGHQLRVDDCSDSGGTASRVWCSKASARQRAGRAGRLFPGVVIRLYTRETFKNLPEFEKPDIELQNLGCTILQVKSLFQFRFPNLEVLELLLQLLDSPKPEDVRWSMQELQTLGAIVNNSSSESCKLTLLGRFATDLNVDVHSARFVLLGVAMGCAVDCVIMIAGMRLPNDIFSQLRLVNREDTDPMWLQGRRIANLRARMHFHGGFASNLLQYCHVYNEWVYDSLQSRKSELRQSSVDLFLLMVRDFAQKTVEFVEREFGKALEGELSKLRTLAAINPSSSPVNHKRKSYTNMPKLCDNVNIVQTAIVGAFSRNWLIGYPAKNQQGLAETRDLEDYNLPAHLSYKLCEVPPNLAGPEILKLEKALQVLGPNQRVVPFFGEAVLVQCRELQKQTRNTPPPVILDLPEAARLANYMAKAFFPKRELVIHTKDPSPTGKVEKLYLGKPSSFRKIDWNIQKGNKMQRVRFRQLNVISTAIEVRKDIPFHIAVAVNLAYTSDAVNILAENVTVLPHEKLFSVLVLLLFRPPGPEGEFQVRILANSTDRIYFIKYQGVTLELAPRFICVHALTYINLLRAKIQGFMGGADTCCNLAADMIHLLQFIRETDFGTPVLAPAIGPWLSFPSLLPVREESPEIQASNGGNSKLGSQKLPAKGGNSKVGSQKLPDKVGNSNLGSEKLPEKGGDSKSGSQKLPEEGGNSKSGSQKLPEKGGDSKSGAQKLSEKGGNLELGSQKLPEEGRDSKSGSQKLPEKGGNLELGSQKLPDKAPPRKLKETQSWAPVLLQSRGDKSTSRYVAKDQDFADGNASRSSDLQLFEQAFEAAKLVVDRAQLIEWIRGNKGHNGVCFELLQRLAGNPGQMEHTKAVLQYVYLRRTEMVNQKQTKALEGLYHSICNPDLQCSTPSGAFGNKVPDKVEVQKQITQAQWKEVRRSTPEMNEDSFISKHVTVNRQQNEAILSQLRYQHFAAKISPVGSFSSGHTGLVTVSGKSLDVEVALNGIITVIIDKSRRRPNWISDDTYSDSSNMGEKVRCVFADGFQLDVSDKGTGKAQALEFMLVRDKQMKFAHDNTQFCVRNSLFHTRMKEEFDRVLEGCPKVRNVKIQARLGRVIFYTPRRFKNCLPFRDGEAKPLGELHTFLGRHHINKRRFDDTISEKEFYHLRTCLHLCHAIRVERHKNYIIMVSNPTAKEVKNREGKFKITDALDAPDRFDIQWMERTTRLAAADIVRLNAGALQVDVRVSMQANEEVEGISEEARDYVRKIRRKGSKLEFPEEPYIVRLQRHKDSEYFVFDGWQVALTTVKQIQAGVSRGKYEVEFEAIEPLSEVGQEVTAVPLSKATSKISLILKHLQSVCSQMSCIGPSSTATGLAQALLRSWTIENDESRLQEILEREFLRPPSKVEVVREDHEEVSLQICSLVEVLYHCDGRILKEGIDVAAELQLVLLRIMQSMNISLSHSIEARVKWFLSNHRLGPENALQYASLLKCHCSPLDRTWASVLQPYLLQLVLENHTDALEKFFFRLNLCCEVSDYSHGQLVHAIMRSSIWTTLSALTRLFHRENVDMFLKLLNAAVTCEETIAPATSFARCFVRDLLSLSDATATAFVGKCLEWTVENESSIMNWKIHMHNVFWLLEMIKMLHVTVDEHCRSKILDLLLTIPSSMESKRELEEALLETYGVDETQFRNRHYQRILQQLGRLQPPHKEELMRRGLDEKRCHDFNFQSWTPGKIRGRDVVGSSLIPGLNESGTRLVGTPGILIPARDPCGQITGAQIKNDDNSTGKRKYVWLSSNKLFNGGKGPQIGGELPLFCCVPRETDTTIVGLCEGGLKAHVLEALSGLPVIGASGANFPGSKNLLQSYLRVMDVEQIIFFPDAGSQCNDQVTSSYFQTFRLLRDWGYNVRVAWWGQVNKAEHDDIDDYLVKNTGAELPLFFTFQFWHIVSLDVREKLQSQFPEYKTPLVFDAVTRTPEADTFTDDDDINIVKLTEPLGSSDYYQIKIPKEVMKKMPRAPDDYVTPQSVQMFTIEVLMVAMHDSVGVEAAMDWLLPKNKKNSTMLGLDCEHGFNGGLNLIQVSTHQRCVLIRLTANCMSNLPHSPRLARVLRDARVVKAGAEVHNDALAIYNTLGLMVNGLRNVSPAYTTMNRTVGMLEIFRNLYDWEYTKKKAITRSDWGCETLTLEQIKYAALDGWASRMIALQGPGSVDKSVTSLENLPEELLKLFARAITNYGMLHREEKTMFETSGNITAESSRSTLRLLQHNFRSRVTSIGSRVELRFNDGQEPALFQAKTRTGKSVVLTPLSNNQSTGATPSSSKAPALPIDISSISNVIVDNSRSSNRQFRRLREVFYDLLCHPDRCPRLLAVALKCGKANKSKIGDGILGSIPKQAERAEPESTTANVSKNADNGKYSAENAQKQKHIGPIDNGKYSAKNAQRGERDVPTDNGKYSAKNAQRGERDGPTDNGKYSAKNAQRAERDGPTDNGKYLAKNLEKQITGSTSRNVENRSKATPTTPKKPLGRPALPREASELNFEHFEEVLAPLNDGQREALHKILTSPISATIGPPGTGKTRLITAIGKAWLKARSEQEVLLCTAYQNVAARNLAEALMEEQVPGVLLLVSEDYFVDWHETFYEKLANSIVVTKSKCEIPGALEDWRTKNKSSSVPILICTLALVGSSAFETSLMGGRVTAMVIDECSQAGEGSCLYPLTCLPDLSLLTVLGDPYQLPPFSGSGPRSMSTKMPSIFDLVSNGCEVKLLKEQYRMPSTICRFISSEIYQSELQTAPNRLNEGEWQHPLLWVNVQGETTRNPGDTSMYNAAEAQAILQLCQKLNESSTKKGVVVLTFYEGQNRRISKLLEAESLQERVSVHNVDSFQGQQSDIVLISLVAGNHFSKFAADRHRACVILTRVKRFLCVCGNFNAVRRNAQAALWQSLADFCGTHGLVVAQDAAESILVSNLAAAATS